MSSVAESDIVDSSAKGDSPATDSPASHKNDESSSDDESEDEYFLHFDKHFRGLLNRCQDVLNISNKNDILSVNKKKSPQSKGIARFGRLYKELEPEDRDSICTLFLETFTKNRKYILADYKDDEWLLENDIRIYSNYVEGGKNTICIYLSSIYQTAKKLRSDTERRLEGAPDEAYDEAKELIYPEVILYHLYNIFVNLPLTSKNISALKQIIGELEDSLNIAKPKSSSGGGLGDIINLATGVMSQVGIEAPEGTEVPDSDHISSALNSVLGDPRAKEAIGQMFTGVQDCNNPQDVIASLLSGFNNPGLRDVIIGVTNGTAEGAKEEAVRENVRREKETKDGQPASAGIASSGVPSTPSSGPVSTPSSGPVSSEKVPATVESSDDDEIPIEP